jgi:hypothetical protein
MSSGRSTPVNGATVPVHPPQQEGSNDNGSNSKRKRDDAEEIKRKKAKTREQEMGEEFAATYHGYTALYKLLEVKHLQSPLFLPRTLGYRVEWRKSRKSKNMKKKNSIKAPRTLRKLFGAKLTDLQILLTSRTKEILRQHAHTLVLRITAYTGKGKHFSTNEFQAIGFCVVPGKDTLNKSKEVPRQDGSFFIH